MNRQIGKFYKTSIEVRFEILQELDSESELELGWFEPIGLEKEQEREPESRDSK